MVRKNVSGIMFTLLFVGVLTLASNIEPVEASGTIYIRADGSVEGTTNIVTDDNITYTLNDTINDSIIVERSNIIIDGAAYTVQCSGTGFYWSGINNVTIKNTNIKNSHHGILLDSSSNNSISSNNITNNDYGIWLYSSSNYNSISSNNITNNDYGIRLDSSSNNSIAGNNITANNSDGIYLYFSSNNSISSNNITNNDYGIWLYSSSNYNRVFHNNLINNTNQLCSYSAMNIWDDGYPSGGNYWSYYTGVDEKSGSDQDQPGSDGIVDTVHEIDAVNRDRYPLMAPFSTFDAGVWNETGYNVDVISNSTVSTFQVDNFQRTISFNVTGYEGTAGFCRINIPNFIVEDLWHGNYTVLLNGEPCQFTNWTDAANTYIYINYAHSKHEIIIVPEFPSATILPLSALAALIATILLKRKRKTKPQIP